MGNKNKDIQIILKFGENVRKYRKKYGWSQEKLGNQSGLAANYIGFLERGERSITLKNVVKIYKALGCPINKLFDGI